MIAVTGLLLGMLLLGRRLTRSDGVVLVISYVIDLTTLTVITL